MNRQRRPDTRLHATVPLPLGIGGSGAPSLPLVLGTLFAVAALLALTATSASARQARLFHGTFGAATSTVPNPYPLSAPTEDAVDTSGGPSEGDVYVADAGNHRIEKFDSAGHFLFMFGAGVLFGGAEGIGDLTAGSTQVTSLETTERDFLVGQEITGAGIAAETTVTSVGVHTLTLSHPAIGSGTSVTLDSPAGSGHVPTNERQAVSLEGAPTGGSFTLSFTTGSTNGTTQAGSDQLTATNGASGSFHPGDRIDVASARGEGRTTTGSKVITEVETGQGAFTVGQAIEGSGIPAGATIAAVGANTLTLSVPVTALITNPRPLLTAYDKIAAIDPLSGDITLDVSAISTSTSSHAATETTDPIPFNANAAQLEEKLETLPGIGAGHVAVTGPAGGPWAVEFQGPRLGDVDVSQMTAGPTALSPATAFANVSTLRSGHSSPEVCHSRCQSGTPASTPGGFEEPKFVTADPSTGDLYADVGSGVPSASERQRLVLPNGVTGGSFTLTFEGETTAPIQYSELDTGRLVQEALEALPSIGKSNVHVPGGASNFEEIIFGGKFTATNVPQLTVDISGLTPGGGAAELFTERQGSPGTPDLIEKFDEDGHLVSSFGNAGQLEASSGSGPASAIVGVAATPSGSLWIIGDLEVPPLPQESSKNVPQAIKFGPEGKVLSSWAATPIAGESQEPAPTGLALDSAEHLYFVEGESQARVVVFSSSGARLGALTAYNLNPNTGNPIPNSEFRFQPTSLTVDPTTGEPYVAGPGAPLIDGQPLSADQKVIYRYSSSCELNSEHIPLHVCPASEFFGTDRLVGAIVSGIAFDPVAKDLYAVDNKGQQLTAFSTVTIPDATTAKATNLTAVDARLNGTVNPSGVALSECLFEWGEAGQPFEHTAPCASPNASEVGSGEVPVAVHADISGLTATKTYHFRLVVSNANTDLAEEPSRGAEVVFGPPKVTASVSAVSATDATLGAQINPQNVATTFHFEYTTQADFEANGFGNATKSPTPDAPAGAGDEEVDRSAPIGGLASNTTYRYRLIAENSVGTAVESPALAFTTQGPATVGLPDARGYELVSPPNKHGAPIEAIPLEGGVIQAAADGSAIAYFAKAPALEEPAGSRSAMNSQLLSARAPAGGWSTADVSTPHQGASGVIPGDLSEYKLFSTDLSRGVVEPFGGTPLSPLTTEKTPYLRQPGGEYTPLVTAANVPAGVKFGGKEGSPEAFGGDVNFITASPDLAHILFTSIQPLTEDFKAGFKPAAANVYEWSGGALQLVSFVPSGTATACGDSGPACKPAAEAGAAALAGAHNYQLRGAISTDGSRVVFETGASRLYQRDLARGETVQLDAAEPACLAQHKCESGGGQFQYASTDGSRVFFTDGRRLTADSAPTSSSGATPDLYMCQIEVKGEEHLACTLTDLTANTVNPSEPANVSGAVLGGAEDGSSVYFVAQGALTEGEGAVHGNCTSSGGVGSGECNLYRYDTATEATSLVAVLSGADRNDWFAAGGIDLGQLTARVSPNGRYLAFMSSQPLTGYDNRDAKTGVRDQEVFLYDSGAEALRCASCDPSGARPHGVLDETPYPHLLVDRPDNWLGQTLAANVPGWTRVNLGYAVYQSRYLSNAGRLFFNAADSLVPADTNGNFDVYQFEFPQGEGQPASNTCTTASATYSPATGGCVSLVSSGTSPEESAFVDASESGNDVFFLTASRLTSRDVDGALDLYDARSGGGEAEAVKPIECSGDACQQPAVPPSDPTPGSLTFQGAGNLLECSKSKVKKSGKCVARKAKKKHHKKNKRTAAHNRGGQK